MYDFDNEPDDFNDEISASPQKYRDTMATDATTAEAELMLSRPELTATLQRQNFTSKQILFILRRGVAYSDDCLLRILAYSHLKYSPSPKFPSCFNYLSKVVETNNATTTELRWVKDWLAISGFPHDGLVEQTIKSFLPRNQVKAIGLLEGASVRYKSVERLCTIIQKAPNSDRFLDKFGLFQYWINTRFSHSPTIG